MWLCCGLDPSAGCCKPNYFQSKYRIELRTNLRGKKFMVHKVGYPEESVILSLEESDMRVSSVYN